LRDVIAVPGEKRLCKLGAALTPAVLSANLPRNLAGTELAQQARECLSQASSLVRDLGTNQHEKYDDQTQQKRINDDDGAAPSFKHAFQLRHQRAHQVGKENREEKGDEGGAGYVKEPQHERKQQHRDQNSRRT
jgi:hypothetical protein